MGTLQNSTPLQQTLSLVTLPPQVGGRGGSLRQHGTLSCRGRGCSFIVQAEQPSQIYTSSEVSQVDLPFRSVNLLLLTSELGNIGLKQSSRKKTPDYSHQRIQKAVAAGRRQFFAVGIITPWLSMVESTSLSFAAETKKGFLSVMDKKDGYSFLYPFGWQEVVIDGEDKVFKDVIEPLESVSVNMIPTSKQNIRDFGPPLQVAETLIKKVFSPPNQKTKLIEASEHDADGKVYYTFEFVARAPNFTRHALSTIAIGNGKFYTLTTGANERRWEKMKDKLQTVVESFKIFDVL